MNANKLSLLILLFLCTILSATAQENTKYLAGAVPVIDGRVLFEREVKVDPSVSADKLLELAEQWAKEEFEKEDKKYEGSNQRVLMVSKDDHYLVVQGDEKLVFKSQILMIDQTTITYQLIVRVEQGKCTLTMRNIKYEYQDYDELMPAEKLITDEYALSKDGSKLNRHFNKFRTFTIDRVDAIENSFRTYLGNLSSVVLSKQEVVKELQQQETRPSVVEDKAVTFATAGYKSMPVEDLSDDIMDMFKDNWVLVTRGSGNNAQVLPAIWSGKGNFGSKQVVMTIVKGGEEKSDSYTISFYTQIHKKALDKIAKNGECELTPLVSPAGATAFSEAWMIIECKRVIDQSATDEMVKDAQSKTWDIKGFNKLLMGEIVSIWVR